MQLNKNSSLIALNYQPHPYHFDHIMPRFWYFTESVFQAYTVTATASITLKDLSYNLNLLVFLW